MPVEQIENPLEVVDISKVDRDTAEKLLDAASRQGFLMIEGHGFTNDEVEQLFQMGIDFFKLPSELKKKYKIGADNCGYSDFGSENLDEEHPDKPTGDPKECFNFANLDLTTGKADQPIPEFFTEEQSRIELVQRTITKLQANVHRMLLLLGMALEIDEKEGGANWFVDRHRNTEASGAAFRFLHYPSSQSLNPEEVIRAGLHTDYGGMTLLFQQLELQSKGLEIFSPITKKWTPVPFVPASPEFEAKGAAAPLVVNIADQLSYWTNGMLKSTIHRVKFPKDFQETGNSRYSIVYFSHPEDKIPLGPVPSEKVKLIKGRGATFDAEKNGGKAMTAGEHLLKRLDTTYYGYTK